jgi:hypothetical protein
MESTDGNLDVHRLASLLSKAVGDEKAEAAVREAAVSLGLGRTTHFSQDQALEILERVASTPGIVGVAARFAKSRLHLA